VRIVAAPNPFKGTASAPAVAEAMARGVRDAFPQATVVELPVADGGEGTVDALCRPPSGELVRVTVTGPLGEPVEAVFGFIPGEATAVVELAASSGLPLVLPSRRDPRTATTYGFGQLLEAARARGARRIIAGVGGSATNDGGAGMAQALGVRLLDAGGVDLPFGGAALARLHRIDVSAMHPGWRDVVVEVAVDVTNPLCGPEGASAVYGPQKGATPAVIDELDAALGHYGRIVGRGVAEMPGSGAAGGAAAGLRAFLDAELRRGAPLVIEAAGLDAALEGAALVLTGEGRVDGQTVYGKGPIEVARRAHRVGVPVAMIAGHLGEGWRAVHDEGVTLVEQLAWEGLGELGDEELAAATPERVRHATARAVRALIQD
jgi:glycerate kinase